MSKKAPRSFATSSGNGTIFVGRNAVQNDEMCANFQEIEPDAMWFHVADVPGAHVILSGSKLVEDMKEAAKYAAMFQKNANAANKKTVVEFCAVSNVFKPKSSSPGEVMLRLEPHRVTV